MKAITKRIQFEFEVNGIEYNIEFWPVRDGDKKIFKYSLTLSVDRQYHPLPDQTSATCGIAHKELRKYLKEKKLL